MAGDFHWLSLFRSSGSSRACVVKAAGDENHAHFSPVFPAVSFSEVEMPRGEKNPSDLHTT